MILSDFPLMSQQHEAIGMMRSRKNTALFMEQGTGKTLTTLAYAETHPRIHKTLVSCRKGNIKTWVDEVNKWTASRAVPIIGSGDKKMDMLQDALLDPAVNYVITNHDITRGGAGKKSPRQKLLKEGSEFLDFWIGDESIEFKNHNSNRNIWMQGIVNKIPRKVILDGRPVTVSPLDLFGQFLLLDGGRTFGDNFYKFRATYFHCVDWQYQIWVLKKNAMVSIHKKLGRTAFRVLRRDCMEMPPVTWKTLCPEMTPQQKKMYKDMEKKFMAEIDDVRVEIHHVIVKLQKMQQIASGFILDENKKAHRFESGKLKMLKEILSDWSYKPIVIWCRYRDEIERIHEMCEEMGIKSKMYHGGISDNKKNKTLDGFLNGEFNVFIGQVSMGVGLNELVIADTAIYFSHSWSLRDRLQSWTRIERKGQDARRLYCIDLATLGTIEEKILQMLKEREKDSDKVLNFLQKRKRYNVIKSQSREQLRKTFKGRAA